MIVIIAAVSKNGVIGDSTLDRMPWTCKEELKHFRKQTLDNVVVMGRTTAEQVGHLSDRDCVVLSRDPNYKLKGFRTLTEDELLNETDRLPDTWYFIAGGAQIYSTFIPFADSMIISTMKFKVNGDVRMPKLDMSSLLKFKTEDYDEFEVNYYSVI